MEEAIFQDCIDNIKTRELTLKGEELILRLSMADEENEEVINALTAELINIQKMLKNGRG